MNRRDNKDNIEIKECVEFSVENPIQEKTSLKWFNNLAFMA